MGDASGPEHGWRPEDIIAGVPPARLAVALGGAPDPALARAIAGSPRLRRRVAALIAPGADARDDLAEPTPALAFALRSSREDLVRAVRLAGAIAFSAQLRQRISRPEVELWTAFLGPRGYRCALSANIAVPVAAEFSTAAAEAVGFAAFRAWLSTLRPETSALVALRLGPEEDPSQPVSGGNATLFVAAVEALHETD